VFKLPEFSLNNQILGSNTEGPHQASSTLNPWKCLKQYHGDRRDPVFELEVLRDQTPAGQ